MKKLKSLIPIGIIVILMVIAYYLGFFDNLNFESLKMHYKSLKTKVDLHPVLSVFVYIGVYFFTVLLSIPGALFLTFLGGFLFPLPLSTLYVVCGATLGACGIFLAAKTALKAFLKKKAGSRLQKMEQGFKKNAVSYLLFLRFIPFFPFWLVNLAPAFFDVSLFTFFWTTLVGITPGAFINTLIGRGLATILEQDTFSINALFNWQIKLGLVGLGIVALIPIIIKKIKKT